MVDSTMVGLGGEAGQLGLPKPEPASRLPLDPPESALISTLVASGQSVVPTAFHRRRIDSTANWPVSASVPTFTHPVLAVTSSTP